MRPRPHTPIPPHFLRRDLIALFAVALLANGLAASFISRPGYMDAYYYFGGAVQLARGQGFTEPYVWNYLDPIRQLPHPSHLYWMPLPSLVAAPFLWLAERLAGTALPNATLFRMAQIPFVLLASALPLLSYTIASLTTPLRRHALAAAFLTLFSGFYFVVWTNTDAFALYGLTAGGALFVYGLTHTSTHPH
ncbi:MAG: putative rane protein, partial [Anaerolineales bacterium]|nr:putative rane protein [Anaerolineales bacterium]